MTTEAILHATLAVIRKEGWDRNGWAYLPPYSIRQAVNYVVAQVKPHGERDEPSAAARAAISAAIGQPLGLISEWESSPKRTQDDVEALLEKAIAGVTG